MTGGLNEVETGMDTVIDHFLTINTIFLFKIRVEASFNVFDNGLPTFIIIDKVTKTWGVNYGETETHAVFFDIYGGYDKQGKCGQQVWTYLR